MTTKTSARDRLTEALARIDDPGGFQEAPGVGMDERHAPDAADDPRAEDAGLIVVMNRCPKIEYSRIYGELSWGGFNSGVISSKRRKV